MFTENRELLDKIDQLQEHFFNYLLSKPIRDISLTAKIGEKNWDNINSLKGQRKILYNKRSYKIEEIYQLILPFVSFLVEVNKFVLPSLYQINERNSHKLSLSPQEKQVRSMLLDNYNENIYLLGDIILDLYDLTVAEDVRINSNKTPLCLSIKEVKNIETDLAFIEESRKQKR